MAVNIKQKIQKIVPLMFAMVLLMQGGSVFAATSYGYTYTAGITGGQASGYATTTDSSNNVYTAGQFYGTIDFDPTSGVDNKSSGNGYAAFVTKINANGTYGYTYVFNDLVNSVIQAGAYAVAVDSLANVYVGGFFMGNYDFDPGAGTDFKSSGTSLCSSAFLTKINANATYGKTDVFGSGSGSYCNSVDIIKIDKSNNIYLGGSFGGSFDFDPTAGTDTHTASDPNFDAFFMKLNSNGTYGYTYTFNGTGPNTDADIALDSAGNVAFAGEYQNTIDLDPTAGTDNKSSQGNYDIYVAKFTSAGGYIGGYSFGGSQQDNASGIMYDRSDSLWINGWFLGAADLDPTAGTNTKNAAGSSTAAYITKLNSNGTYAFSKVLTNSSDVVPRGILQDNNGYIYTTGIFSGTLDFDPNAGTDNKTASGYESSFMTKYDTGGNYLGTDILDGNNGLSVWAASIDSQNLIYLTGSYDSTVSDFNPTVGVDSKTAIGDYDYFLTKLVEDAKQQAAPSPPPAAPVQQDVVKTTAATPSSTTDTTAPTSTDNGQLLNDLPTFADDTGTQVQLSVNEVVHFVLPADQTSEKHTATVDLIGPDFAMLTIASEPIKLKLSIGETRAIDVDRDGTKDITVTLKGIENGHAVLVFKQLVAASQKVAIKTAAAVQKPKNSSSTKYIAGAGLLVAMGVVGGAIYFFKRKAHGTFASDKSTIYPN